LGATHLTHGDVSLAHPSVDLQPSPKISRRLSPRPIQQPKSNREPKIIPAMDARKQGRPDEELFLRPSETAQTPTISPLRIQKNDLNSRSPPPRTDSAGSSNQPTFSRPPPMPTFPAPPTAPPTAPLPYPDDRPYRQTTAPPGEARYTPLNERERAARNATPPDSEGRRRRSSATGPSPTSPGSRARFTANDPNRPTVSGYGAHPGRTQDGSIQPSRLAERRGTAPRPLPESPGPETPDKEGLFQMAPRKGFTEPHPPQAPDNTYLDYQQQHWIAPDAGPLQPNAGRFHNEPALMIPNPGGVNRLSSTASTSTTRAQRGSPPPPETPIIPPPGGGIEARFAAAGIAGSSTLNNLQAQNVQNAAAAQRNQVYGNQPPRQNVTSPIPQQQPPRRPWTPTELPAQQEPPRRPWTPTEQPGSHPHGPPAIYQGMNELGGPSTSPPQGPLPQAPSGLSSPPPANMAQQNPLAHDMGRMNLDEPPPAYSSITHPPGGATTAQGYPNEKRNQSITSPAPQASVMSDPNMQGHPAFANDVRQQQPNPAPQQPGPMVAPTPTQSQFPPQQVQHTSTPSPAPGPGPASPPPLPEGWIAHLDTNSGQYYYIHLPTQSTQWEFPKGPTPLNLNEPMSPTNSYSNPLASPGFGKTPLNSPGFPTQQATFHGDMMGMAPLATPTTTGFTGPPPVAGVDTYKINPTNSVYFGPYLRYTNMDVERGLWLGSILLVTNTPHPPTIHLHQSVDLSPNPRQLKANPIYSHQTWMFYRYDIEIKMEEEHGAKWTYAITSHLGCTRFEFLVAGRHETSWRFIAHSGNDFALNVNANERAKLGGLGFMWKDILQKNTECGGFHVQLGLGGQIYADRLWKEIPLLKQWTATSGKETRKNAPWTAKHDEEVCHAYFHYYTSHFDQPHLREAFAQIPHILALDDHDM
jgi:hypothetical protein